MNAYAPLIGSVEPPGLHVMSFNLRRRIDLLAWSRRERWASRRLLVQAMLRAEQPTVMGMQEVLPDQARTVAAALGPHYRFVGHGREKNRGGEGSPIFFDVRRLELLHAAQTALSDSPHVSGSRSWGNPMPRVLVSAVFRDRETDRRFAMLNTHLDAFSARARVKSAGEIRRRAAELRHGEGLPVVLTGDLNAKAGSPVLRELLAGDLRDAWATADVRLTPEWQTYARYRRPSRVGGRIDWIVVTPGIRVRSIGVNARPIDGSWPSDHLPVQAVVEWDEEAR